MPRKPYRSPREWLPASERKEFGLADRLDWLTPGDDREAILLLAAQKQHSLAMGIRTHRIRKAIAPDELAARADLSTPTVRNILNGSKWADLAVLHLLADAVSLDLSVTARPPREAAPDQP